MTEETRFKLSNIIKYTIEIKEDKSRLDILIEYKTVYTLCSLGLICEHMIKAKYNKGAFITGFECNQVEGSNVTARIEEFMLDEEHRRKGIGTFIMAKLYSFTPNSITKNLTLSGKLTSADNSPERNTLYKNLSGNTSLKVDENGDGFFKGSFNDLSNRYKNKIQILDISYEDTSSFI